MRKSNIIKYYLKWLVIFTYRQLQFFFTKNKFNIHISKNLQLSKQTYKAFDSNADEYLNLPEKILQFGTGVLLRALPDYYIDTANKQNVFNGRVVMVKSTDTNTNDFEKQDCLYTLCIRGVENGKNIEENVLNASISRVLTAKNDWKEILELATSKDLQVIISNTTEVGIQLSNDGITDNPPASFPGKLLACLYHRYQSFNGNVNKGLVIIPTELIVDNGKKLLSIILQMVSQNKLEPSFSNWLTNANDFCNSLVDRIVPGKLNPSYQQETEQKIGYTDDLMIMAEVYNLWAIETSSQKVKDLLSFSQVNEGVVIVPDISIYRELKLRLLNGAHTFSCGLAYLAGFTTVKEAMNNIYFYKNISGLMLDEIAVAIAGDAINIDEANEFATKVLDRFRNTYIEHAWLNITMQYSSKMLMRNISTLKKYAERFKKVPLRMALGFAAYLLFTKPDEMKDNKYYGSISNKKYFINDDKASYYYKIWQEQDVQAMVTKVLSDKALWEMDLTEINGFAKAVEEYLQQLITEGAMKTIESIET